MLLALVSSAGPSAAQDPPDRDPPVGSLHLSELNYLIGEWRVRTFTRDETSEEWTETSSPSWYRARRLRDGRSILAEFYETDPDGFYGVHLISRGMDGEFLHSYLNSKANRRLVFSGRREGMTYHLERRGGYGGGDFLYRETDSEIGPDSFTKEVFRSEDDGRTWQQQGYRFRFERLRSQANG